MSIDDYITMTEFAKRVKRTRQAILKAIKTGSIKDFRTYGRVTLINVNELARYK